MAVLVPPMWYRYHLWYSRAKSGAADSDCGVKLGAESSLSGFNHCVSSSKTTVVYYRVQLYRYCTALL